MESEDFKISILFGNICHDFYVHKEYGKFPYITSKKNLYTPIVVTSDMWEAGKEVVEKYCTYLLIIGNDVYFASVSDELVDENDIEETRHMLKVKLFDAEDNKISMVDSKLGLVGDKLDLIVVLERKDNVEL